MLPKRLCIRKTKRIAFSLCAGLLLWYWYTTFKVMREFWAENNCVANLHALHTGLALYAQDYDQSLPVADVWMDRTKPYLHREDRDPRYIFHCSQVPLKPLAYGYAFNRLLSGAVLHQDSASTVLVYDSQDTRWNANAAATAFADPPRHHSASKHPFDFVIFTDGHTQEADAQTIKILSRQAPPSKTTLAPP